MDDEIIFIEFCDLSEFLKMSYFEGDKFCCGVCILSLFMFGNKLLHNRTYSIDLYQIFFN